MSKAFDFLLDEKNATELVSSIPYAEYLGIRIQQNINGEIIFLLPFHEKHIGNPMIRAIHGGIIASFLECSSTLMVIGTVCHDHLPKCVNHTTEYLKSAKGVDTFARVKVNKAGRRIVAASVSSWQKDESTPIAISYSRFLVNE
ncbi:MAG: PaaI family thioesterase [Pseudomonadales bacterium]|nr:PaaI family thioesterase [Pseudomonadales bacterium]